MSTNLSPIKQVISDVSKLGDVLSPPVKLDLPSKHDLLLKMPYYGLKIGILFVYQKVLSCLPALLFFMPDFVKRSFSWHAHCIKFLRIHVENQANHIFTKYAFKGSLVETTCNLAKIEVFYKQDNIRAAEKIFSRLREKVNDIPKEIHFRGQQSGLCAAAVIRVATQRLLEKKEWHEIAFQFKEGFDDTTAGMQLIYEALHSRYKGIRRWIANDSGIDLCRNPQISPKASDRDNIQKISSLPLGLYYIAFYVTETSSHAILCSKEEEAFFILDPGIGLTICSHAEFESHLEKVLSFYNISINDYSNHKIRVRDIVPIQKGM